MSAIEQKWRNTGLLDGNNGIDAELLAHSLNESAQVLVAEAIHLDGPLFDSKAAIFLPVVVRLFNDGMRILDIEKLYHNYTEWFATIPITVVESVTGEHDCVEAYLKYITTDGLIDTFML